MRTAHRWLLALGTGLGFAAAAQDGDPPDLGFLEYLGSWQEGDEEWLVVAGMGDELDAAASDTDPNESAGDVDDERPAEATDED